MVWGIFSYAYLASELSSLVKCLIEMFPIFIGLFIFLLLSFENSLCICDVSPCQTCDLRVFLQSVDCFFIHLAVSFAKQNC